MKRITEGKIGAVVATERVKNVDEFTSLQPARWTYRDIQCIIYIYIRNRIIRFCESALYRNSIFFVDVRCIHTNDIQNKIIIII